MLYGEWDVIYCLYKDILVMTLHSIAVIKLELATCLFSSLPSVQNIIKKSDCTKKFVLSCVSCSFRSDTAVGRLNDQQEVLYKTIIAWCQTRVFLPKPEHEVIYLYYILWIARKNVCNETQCNMHWCSNFFR